MYLLCVRYVVWLGWSLRALVVEEKELLGLSGWCVKFEFVAFEWEVGFVVVGCRLDGGVFYFGF